jgi:MarR family transcriptional regulator, temperature-dependent positive regulator of motility
MDKNKKNNNDLKDEFLISDLISIIYKSYKHYLIHQLTELNVTPGQIPFIMELMHSKSLYQSDLTEKLLLSRAVTAKTLKKLDEKDIIKREIAEDNRRKNKVHLTEKGRDIASKVDNIEKEWNKIVVNKFSEKFSDFDENELKEMLSSLAKSSTETIMDKRNDDDFYNNPCFGSHPFKGHPRRNHFEKSFFSREFSKRRDELREHSRRRSRKS